MDIATKIIMENLQDFIFGGNWTFKDFFKTLTMDELKHLKHESKNVRDEETVIMIDEEIERRRSEKKQP
jgi:hypothetical protein